MSVYDLWQGLSKAEITAKRAAGAPRWKRRWREGRGRDARQRSQTYPEAQRVQAYQDDAAQQGDPRAQRRARASVTVETLVARHLATKADKSPGTIRDYEAQARHVLAAWGDRVVSTIDATEVATWAARTGVAARSRKKQVELLRAAIRRGIRDGLVDSDPTVDVVVSLGHKEVAYLASEELAAVLTGARDDYDRALLGVMGLMGLRQGEATSLRVGDLTGDHLRVTTSGAASDRTKTRASTRLLPVPASLLPMLEELARDRSLDAWLFESPRRPGHPVGETYAKGALTRAITAANVGRGHPIRDLTPHGLRHTYAAVCLGELHYDLVTVSRALGHARPSITLDRYGHLSRSGLADLTSAVDGLGLMPARPAEVTTDGAGEPLEVHEPPVAPQLRPEIGEGGVAAPPQR